MSEQQYKDVDGCVLWKRTAKNGKLYLGGQVEIGDEIFKVRAFINEQKKSADSPDFFYRKRGAEAVEKKKTWEEIVAAGSRNGEGYNC